MNKKRFVTNKWKIYDLHKDDEWLVNEVEAEEITEIMNNLDLKARERSKALSKLQKENEELKEEIARQKYTKSIMRDNIKDYERSIKSLRKSFEKFDEMRLRRIRFLEKRLKKNGLSIYVNDAGGSE